ncbi:Microtubule-associated protein, microtubule dynamics during spindle orientation [Borealophlyctis nickersoniae]|nr:Microtubule-associated protein, microtubule dynamics during spindle orientation [Borealophlyctis nickersoniae]
MGDAEEEWKGLPLSERLTHKAWNARKEAYEEVTKLFNTLDPDAEAEFRKYQDYLKKMVSDANLVAQEAGMGAVLAWVKNAPSATKTRSVLVPMVVDKGLGSTRAGTKAKALDLLMMFIEIDIAEPVIEDIIPGVNHKTPKNVVGAVGALREALRLFGPKVVPVKVLMKQLPKIFDHKDKNVRAEGTNLALELYRWLGPAISNSLNDLKPVQIKELNDQFEKMPSERAVPERLLRSEQAKVEAQGGLAEAGGASGDGAANEEGEEQEAPVDAFDLADPVNVLDKLPPDFYEKVASSKWKERKEELEKLVPLLKVPKLEDGRYGELVSVLGKKINDANLFVVVAAANCIEHLARGIRQNFAQYRGLVVHPLLEKFKEKKANVVEALRGALDAVYATSELADFVEDIVGTVTHKNPQVRQETVQWLTRCLKTTRKQPGKPEIKSLSEALVKTMDDSVDVVREAAAEALGTLMKVVSERVMAPYLEKLEKLKEAKVREYFAKAEVKCVGKRAPTASAAAPPAAAPARRPGPPKNKAVAAAAAPKPRPMSTPAVASSAPKATNAPMPAGKKRATIAAAPVASKKAAEDAPISYKFSDASAEQAVVEVVGEEPLKQLVDSSWKIRLEAVQSILETLKKQDKSSVEAEAFVTMLAKKPGWKESNFQVTTNMFNIFQFLAKDIPSFNRAAAAIAIPGLVDKLGDMKVKRSAGDCMTTIAESLSLNFVLNQAYEPIKKQKAPKVIADCLMWIQQNLLEFGTAGVGVRDLIDFVKVALANTNPAVRNNAVTVLGAIRMFTGPEIRSFVQDLNPQLLAIIDAEFEKAAAKGAPQPSRVSQVEVADAGHPTEDLFPRVDIGAQISSKIIQDLGDANWKIRKEGLEEVMKLIDAANKRIKGNLGNELMPALKARLSDTNKNLAIVAVELCGTLATAMGKPFDKHVRVVIGPMTSLLGDQKAHVRGAAIASLDNVFAAVGLDTLIPSFATSLMPDQPQLRKDLLKWLVDKLELSKDSLPDLSSMVHPILLCLQDRNADVRKSAQAVLQFVAQQEGSDIIRERSSDLFKGAALASLTPYLESLPGSLKAVPAPVASSRPGTPAKTKKAGVPVGGGGLAAKTKAPVGLKPKGTRPSGSSLTLKKEPAEDFAANGAREPPVLPSDLKAKEQRANADRGMQKWTFDQPRRDLVDFLSDQCVSAFSPEVHAWMFSNDHYKEKDFLSALSSIDEPLATNMDIEETFGIQPNELRSRYVASTDLILKYVTLRFFDTNTSMLLKCLELLEHLFAVLDEEGYHLSEYEAASFIPFFVGKTGDNKETVRVKIRGIMKQLTRVYPASKLFSYLMKGLESKNSRTRTECLEELASLVQRNGMSVCSPSKSFPLVAAQLADRDASVRNGALNVITQAYLLVGDAVYKHIGRMSDKDKSLVEERLKRLPPGSAGSAAKAPVRRDDSPRRGGLATALNGGAAEVAMSPAHKRRVSSGTSISAAGVKKEFSLDLDKLDFPRAGRSVSGSYGSGGDIRSSSRSRTSTPDDIFLDPTLSMDMIMAQVTSSDAATSVEGIKQLEKIVASAPDTVLPHVNEIVPTLTLQIRIVLTASDNLRDPSVARICKHLINVLVQIFSVPKLAKKLTKDRLHQCIHELLNRLLDPTLKEIDETNQLGRALNMLMVRILENSDRTDCFSILLDGLAKSSLAMRSISPDQYAAQYAFTEIAMKCLWKMTKVISQLITNDQLRIENVILDIHNFLVALPPAEWKKRTAENIYPKPDMAFRTVKTILHELVNSLGENVLQHLGLIPHPDRSHAVQYLKQMIDNEKKKAKQSAGEVEDGNQASEATQSNGTSRSPASLPTPAERPASEARPYTAPTSSLSRPAPTRPSSRTLSDDEIEATLTPIFERISSKELTRQGIKDLYDFRKQHPYVDPKIEQRLANLGGYFKGYIRRGLAALEEAELEGDRMQREPVARPRSFLPNTQASSGDEEGASGYKETLARLQQMFANGYNNDAASSAPVSNARPASPAGAGNIQSYRSTIHVPPSSIARFSSEERQEQRPASMVTASPGFAARTSAEPAASGAPPPSRTQTVAELKERLARMKMNMSATGGGAAPTE